MSNNTLERRRALLFALCALIAFAANSILARLALGDPAIDPAGYTSIRLLSGAIILAAFAVLRNRKSKEKGTGGSWVSGLLLFLYAVSFSFAYVSLSTGTGALILFGSVQATMVIAGLVAGERPHAIEWTGLVVALAGLVCLVFPGLQAPDPAGALLMATSGISWGWYTIRGRRAGDPLGVTAGNFLKALPWTLLLCWLFLDALSFSPQGVALAVGSGAIASGLGYVVWYMALRGLTAARASVIQLAVPVIAAIGGVLFLSEDITARLLLAAVLILGGIALALFSRRT